MTPEVIVSVISLFGTLVGTLGGICVSNRISNYRIEQLEKKVEKHNNLIERTYAIEQHNAVVDEEIKVANHRIEDLEKTTKGKNENEKIFTKQWAKATAVRAIKTVAQTAVATIGVSAVMTDVNWIAVGSASLLAGVLSVLTSIAGLPEVNESEE